MGLKVYTGSAFETKTLKVNAVANLIPNPDFAGSGAVADTYSPYINGTAVGTRSLASGMQTITATSIAGGNRRFGISNFGTSRVRIETDSVVYYKVTVDTTGLAVGTQAFFYFEESNDTNTLHYRETRVSAGEITITGSWTTHSSGLTRLGVFLFGITASADWSGTSTAIFSKAIVSVLNPGETPPAWFSGASSGCAWKGTANASISLAPGFRTARVKRYNGSAWVSV